MILMAGLKIADVSDEAKERVRLHFPTALAPISEWMVLDPSDIDAMGEKKDPQAVWSAIRSRILPYIHEIRNYSVGFHNLSKEYPLALSLSYLLHLKDQSESALPDDVSEESLDEELIRRYGSHIDLDYETISLLDNEKVPSPFKAIIEDIFQFKLYIDRDLAPGSENIEELDIERFKHYFGDKL